MKFKNLTLFSIGVAIFCIAARTVTLLYATQSGTGFFISRLSSLGISLSISIFLLAIVAVIFAFALKGKAHSPFELSKLSGIASFLLGFTILLNSFGFNSHSFVIQWQYTLEVIAGILAGCWFIIYGVGAFIKFKLPDITAIIPCVYFILRLVVVFTALSTSALVAEHVFSLAYHVSVMVFMLYFGRAVAGVPSKNISKTFFPIKTAAFIFTTTSVFSRLIMLLLGKTEMIHSEAGLDLTGIMLSIFMILITADIYKESKKVIKEEDSNEL